MENEGILEGFDWNNIDDVLAKIDEELLELKTAVAEKNDPAHIEEELGDLIFSCVNAARHLNIHPESALRRTVNKCMVRWEKMEAKANAAGQSIDALDLQAMDRLWTDVKREETSSADKKEASMNDE